MLTLCLIAGCESPQKGDPTYEPYPGDGDSPCLNIMVYGVVADSTLLADTQWLGHVDGGLADISLSEGIADENQQRRPHGLTSFPLTQETH